LKLQDSYAWLRLKFILQNKSIAEIAKEAKCSEATIRRRLKDARLIK